MIDSEFREAHEDAQYHIARAGALCRAIWELAVNLEKSDCREDVLCLLSLTGDVLETANERQDKAWEILWKKASAGGAA